MWRKGTPSALLVGCKWLRLLGKTVRRVLRKLKPEIPFDPAISLLGAYPKEMKTLTQRSTNKHVHVHRGIVYNSQDRGAT